MVTIAIYSAVTSWTCVRCTIDNNYLKKLVEKVFVLFLVETCKFNHVVCQLVPFY